MSLLRTLCLLALLFFIGNGCSDAKNRQVQELSEKAKQTEADLKLKQVELEMSRQQSQVLSKELENLKTRLAEVEKDAAALRLKLAEAEAENKRLSLALTERKSENNNLSEQLKQANEAIQKSAVEIAVLKEREQTLKAEKEKLITSADAEKKNETKASQTADYAKAVLEVIGKIEKAYESPKMLVGSTLSEAKTENEKLAVSFPFHKRSQLNEKLLQILAMFDKYIWMASHADASSTRDTLNTIKGLENGINSGIAQTKAMVASLSSPQ